MNVLFICDEYPPGRIGGIGTAVQTLARELDRQGHRVIIAGLYPYNYGQKDYEEDAGIKIYRKRFGWKLGLGMDSKLQYAINHLPDVMRRIIYQPEAFQRFLSFLQELIVKEKIDIIEAPDFSNFPIIMGIKAQWPAFDVPFVVKSHGSLTYFCHEMGETSKPKIREMDELLFKRGDALSSVSGYTAELNKKLFGNDLSFTILYNGILMSETKPVTQRDPKTVIFTGALVVKKGIFSLLQSWNKVHIKHPDAKLLVLGKGNPAKLEKWLEAPALKTVDFLGHVPREKVMEHLSKATLGVFPSYSESFGLGPVEAMAAGCPVIYTSRSCGPEIVKEGRDGFLVDPDNIVEIAEKICRLLEEPETREKFSASAFETVRNNFEIGGLAKKHIDFYQKTINDFRIKKETQR